MQKRLMKTGIYIFLLKYNKGPPNPCSLITRFPRLLPQRLLGTTNIEGKVAPQGLGVAWWTNTKYINDLERSIRQ